MALPYVPTTWKSGDLVSSTRLNKLEGGVKENSDAIVTNTADVSQLKSEIADIEQSGFDLPMLMNKYTVIPYIIGTSGKWANITGFSSFMLKRPTKAKSVTIKGNSARGSVFALLTSDAHSANTTPNYATGSGRTFISAGVEKTVALPDDCKYVVIMYTADGNDWTPDFAVFSFIDNEPFCDDTAWKASSCIMANYWSEYSSPGDVSSASNVLAASDYILINAKEGQMLECPMMWASDATYPNYGLCLYDINGLPVTGRAIGANYKRGSGDSFYVTLKIYLPKNVKYIRTTYWSASWLAEHPTVPAFFCNLIDTPDELKPITHEMPVDSYMQNSIRRARQLTDIKWTPHVNIPRYSMINGGTKHFLDWFYADKEYVGIPYTGAGGDVGQGDWKDLKDWGYSHNWVGQHIPIEAFVTAARFPNSIFGETASQSTVEYDSSPFGVVCTALVNYAVNGPTPLRIINNFFSLSTGDFISLGDTIGNIDVDSLSIGDFLYTSEHVIMITDLIRGEDGHIAYVEMSEATTVGNANNAILGTQFGGVSRRKMWEVNEWKELYSAYTPWRKKTFYGIPYTPSRYVDTGNEGDRTNIVDMACIPYLGNGAVYKVGYIHNSKVCIGATGFTSLVVTKDGEAFDTFDVTGLTEIEVGFSEAGSYEAYLSDGTTRTVACKWTVE